MDKDQLLEKLEELSEKNEIKYTTKQLRKFSAVRLEKIYQDYEQQQLEATNELLASMLTIKFEELLKFLELIQDDSNLAKKLQDRTLFQKDL